jgi:L-ascorbate metabolism protein UlaG (beta-lactamase superfamily)
MTFTRRGLLQSAGVAGLAANAFAANPAHPINQNGGAEAPQLEITWVGGATMIIAFGSLSLLTDPTLGETFAMGDPNDLVDHQTIRMHRRLTPLSGVDLKMDGLVLLSHAHPDHFDEAAAASLNPELPFILPVADLAAVGAKGFRNLLGLNWGETRQFHAKTRSVSITAMPARHSRDQAVAQALGIGNGYWISFRADTWSRTLYWTGDTMPTEDVIKAVRAYGEPDIMVPHVGGVGTTGPFGQISMNAADVVALASEIRPKSVLPIHHSTYAFYREPISELAKQSTGGPYRLDLVPAGTTLVYR